jgi:hypothetical protein
MRPGLVNWVFLAAVNKDGRGRNCDGVLLYMKRDIVPPHNTSAFICQNMAPEGIRIVYIRAGLTAVPIKGFEVGDDSLNLPLFSALGFFDLLRGSPNLF